MEDVGFWQGLMTGIGAWFVLGSGLFWLVLAAVGGLIIWITEAKNDFFAVVLLVAVLWIVFAVNDLSLTANPLQWLKYLGLYLLIGAAWSFVKWTFFLFRMRTKLVTLKESYVANNDITLEDGKFSKQDFPLFASYLNNHGYHPNGDYKGITKPADVIPKVSSRAGDLIRWIVWWPTSMVWAMLNDVVRIAADWIVQVSRVVYAKIASVVFAGDAQV